MVKVNPGSSYENIHHMKTLVVLEYSMLYTKFQGHRPLGSEEEDFLCFSPYVDMVMLPGTFEQIFIPHIPLRLHMKFGFNRPRGF